MLRRLGLVTLPVAGFICAVLLLSGRAHADNVCTPDAGWGTLNTGFASQVLTLINQDRASIGEGPLTIDWALNDSAQWKSMNMSGYDYFDHTDDPIGRSPEQRLLDCGYPATSSSWGENIAEGFSTPASVVQAWLNSPGHKANIEYAGYTTTGIGVAYNSSGYYYWTQDFGSVSSPGGPPTTTRTTTTGRTTTTTGTTTRTTTTTATTTSTTTATGPPPPQPPPTTATTTTAKVGQPAAHAKRHRPRSTIAGHPRVEHRRHFTLVHWKLKRHAERPARYLVLGKRRVLIKTEHCTVKLSKRVQGRIRIVAVLPNGERERAVGVKL
jgi:uncharacterized protein YkwD